MFSLHDRPYTLCDRISRRELMQDRRLEPAGAVAARPAGGPGPRSDGATAGDPTFGRAKNIIYLWLQGGPPQHETFDPKPDAPLEIRGPFKPISTNVPGIQFCELLPRTAAHGRQAGRGPLDVDRRQHARHQRLLGADRQQVRSRQRARDQAQRLALLRLGRQDAQAQHAGAGADDASGFPTSCG